MNSPPPQESRKSGRSDIELLLAARAGNGPRKYWTYFRLLGPGWKRLDSDVNGEAGYQTILDQFLMSPSESRRAAAGWGGDRFDVYEGSGGSAVIQMTAWDTEADAREFFEAYTKRTELRYKQPKPAGVSIERRGSRVLIIEGLPASAEPTAVTRAIWG